MPPSQNTATASAETCSDHPDCICFHRPDGAINEAGEWHALWTGNAWRVRGPDPADAGFPTLGGPIDKTITPDLDRNPIAALLPYVGEDAVLAALEIHLPSDQGSAASRP